MERGSVVDNQETVSEYCTRGDFWWSTIINGKEYWADSVVKIHQLHQALDPNYGVLVIRPKQFYPLFQ